MGSGNWKQAIPLGQREVGLSVWQIIGVPEVPGELSQKMKTSMDRRILSLHTTFI